jgi:hypothetical protein
MIQEFAKNVMQDAKAALGVLKMIVKAAKAQIIFYSRILVN